ncbi:helix-turn-helix domain-containing protein, partial [Kitasatospora phosalacinea]|uniref:helix-turn-helix domain-containing protein n=1 Tax=Kitasatospora phosalacinea TaxID=2065 RepID=UPI0005250656
MDAKQTAEYLNVSLSWLYREATDVGLVPYKFGRGRNAKSQFNKVSDKVSEVNAWIKQQRLSE